MSVLRGDDTLEPMSVPLGDHTVEPITPPSESSGDAGTPRTRRLYQLTVCGYKKPGISEEDYHDYMSNKHAQVVKGVMAKYGVLTWTHSHNTTETRKLMAKLYDAQFSNIADYDCFSQSTFESIDSLVKMKEDPLYDAYIRDDHENFADTKRTRITVGWFEEYIRDGKTTWT